jgi:hypothetical protein
LLAVVVVVQEGVVGDEGRDLFVVVVIVLFTVNDDAMAEV